MNLTNLAAAIVLVTWDVDTNVIRCQDTLLASVDMTNWTAVPGPYETVSNRVVVRITNALPHTWFKVCRYRI